MSDLVKRLRGPWGDKCDDDYQEAADRIDALEAALEPFGDIDGEGDEDFPDETPVVVTFGRTTHYALKLGDFRRARAALKQD